jgi:hypothetical protein
VVICPNCGKEAPSEAAFCSYCGTSLTAIPPPQYITEVPAYYQIQTATIIFDEKASRFELLVRIIWGFLISLVSFIYGLAFGIIVLFYSLTAAILNTINFIKILITGKRWKTAFDWQAKLINKSANYYIRIYNYLIRRAPYLGLMTDKRPPLDMEKETSKMSKGSSA